jgi:hypothetical protein
MPSAATRMSVEVLVNFISQRSSDLHYRVHLVRSYHKNKKVPSSG